MVWMTFLAVVWEACPVYSDLFTLGGGLLV